jgi:amino-acid N-acetyltransferase
MAYIQDFILSILQASPSMRDSKSYLSSFAPDAPQSPNPTLGPSFNTPEPVASEGSDPTDTTETPVPARTSTPGKPLPNQLVTALLNPRIRRTALVKIQGPFTDIQLNAIAKGMANLQKLGLVSVIVVDRDDIPTTEPHDHIAAQRQRTLMLRDVERMVSFLNRHRAPARPILATVARMADGEAGVGEGEVFVEQEGLDHVRRAVGEGEIPVLLPVALDTNCRSRRVGANPVLASLAEIMRSATSSSAPATSGRLSRPFDLTPMRLLVINREGGIPSYARSGMPHLSINLSSEFDFIRNTFQPRWRSTHPTALSNLALAKACLEHMPREASALIVSHRSPAAMIGNLITNKPAHSASLPHALLAQSENRITRDTPTLIRRGSPVKIHRSIGEVDKPKLQALLETSFRRKLDAERFWRRLETDLDFVIVIGDYAGAAVCTLEGRNASHPEGICYLDKFAVLPSHQGDGTVDFLWVALRDETYGLGLLDAANPSEGSLSGVGRGRDLVWRSRADNPVNKWYYERSNGFLYLPPDEPLPPTSGSGEEVGKKKQSGWKMFWCDAEERIRAKAREEGREFGGGSLVRIVEAEERGRLERWAPVVGGIKSSWQ